MSELSKSAQIVQEALAQKGSKGKVIELSERTHTAQQAADALECSVGQIVKSLMFQRKDSKAPVLILVSGSNVVDIAKVSDHIGEQIVRAKHDFVREVTGFAIGGIPPLGHKEVLETYVDKDLLTYDTVWAAAGTPHAVVSLSADVLKELVDVDSIISVS